MNDREYDNYVYKLICVNNRISSRFCNGLIKEGYIENIYGLKNFIFERKYKELDLSEELLEKLNATKKDEDQILINAEKQYKKAKNEGIFTISSEDKEYPLAWRQLSGMPQIIFCKGDKNVLNKANLFGSVAVVGSRYPSRYALNATDDFVSKLAGKNIVTVSGMALGTDRRAHEVALDNNTSTIAFVPGGVDVIYPYSNKDVYHRIVDNGIIISELLPGTEVIRKYFPSRNRLISGMGDACLIMEAGANSGTLHTASFAANQGKSVFVLPNTIYSENAIGGLKLLEDGALLLFDVENVLDVIISEIEYRYLSYGTLMQKLKDEFGNILIMKNKDKNYIMNLLNKAQNTLSLVTDDEWEQIIEEELKAKSRDIDELLAKYKIEFTKLSEILTSMEISGKIESAFGKYSLTK